MRSYFTNSIATLACSNRVKHVTILDQGSEEQSETMIHPYGDKYRILILSEKHRKGSRVVYKRLLLSVVRRRTRLYYLIGVGSPDVQIPNPSHIP